MNLELWDVPPHASIKDRQALYRDVDIVFICFAISSPSSLDSVKEKVRLQQPNSGRLSALADIVKWAPEVQQHAPTAVVILVGTKVDLRGDQEIVEALREKQMVSVSREAAVQVAKEIKATEYLDCSALHPIYLKRTVDDMLRGLLHQGSIVSRTTEFRA